MYVHREKYFNKQIKHSEMRRTMIRKWRLEQGIVDIALRKKKHKNKSCLNTPEGLKQHTRKERINTEFFCIFT